MMSHSYSLSFTNADGSGRRINITNQIDPDVFMGALSSLDRVHFLGNGVDEVHDMSKLSKIVVDGYEQVPFAP